MAAPRDLRRVLVTGGAGFIGSTLVRRLLAAPETRVACYDSLTYAGLPESLAEIASDPRYEFHRGDVADGEAVRRFVEAFRPDTLFHLAAESHVDRSIARPDPFVTTNIVGTATLLKAWRAHSEPADGPERPLFVHVSTDEVYGPQPEGVTAREGDPYLPSSPYAASKAAADHLVQAYGTTYGVRSVITHATNNYGPRQFPEKLIPLVVERALTEEPIPLYGDGLQSRDWIHVEDHCRALVEIARRGAAGGIYHIGAEDVRSNRSVVEAICDILDELRPAGRPRRELIENVADRPGHDRRYSLDTAKLRNELGWKPGYSFEKGLRETVEWQLANRDWVEAARRRVGETR